MVRVVGQSRGQDGRKIPLGFGRIARSAFAFVVCLERLPRQFNGALA